MKTEYRIIWVDDEIDAVSTDISDTKDFLERHGIAAQIITFEATEDTDIHSQIAPALSNPDLDLIVVDYKMDGMNGRDLIDAIRDTDHVFLPVIFYSTVGADELHKQAAEAKLDGVYIAHRDRVRTKIEEVVASLLVKEQTSKRTRGLLMEGVSELDANFGKLFLNMWDQQNDDTKSELISYLKEKLEERATNTQNLVGSLPGQHDDFRTYMEKSFVSGSYDTITRWKILKKQFSLLNLQGNEIDTFLRLFDKKTEADPLIKMRNDYGHKTRAELEGRHNGQVCVGIRRELRTQLKNVNKLLS